MHLINQAVLKIIEVVRRQRDQWSFMIDIPASFLKSVTVITVFCFLLTSVFSQALFAITETRAEAQKVTALLDDCFIPHTLGRISGGKDLGSKTVVVEIQDLHCHPEVQKNISKLLSVLDKKYRLKNIYVEGAYGDVDTSWLCNIKDKKLKEEITENLLQEGRLTGAEYYSVTSNRPRVLKGIEDEKLHKENIVRLGKILDRKGYFEKKLTVMSRELRSMQEGHSGIKNKKFNDITGKYQKGEVQAARYYKLLEKYVRDINAHPERYNGITALSMEDYPVIEAYLSIIETGEKLNYTRVSRELGELLGVLKARLPYGVYSELVERTDSFQNQGELYLSLSRLARDYGFIKSGHFGELSRFFEYVEKNQQINPSKLAEEERRLAGEIRLALSEDIAELEISFLADFYVYFNDYLLTRLSADDYEYFKPKINKFQQLWDKYAFTNSLGEFTEDFKALDEYYQVNCKRNDCFITHLDLQVVNSTARHQPEYPFLPSKDADLVVIVAGGFHTEGLSRLLEEQKISYLTITPSVTQDTRYSSDAYVAFAREQAQILSQALALGLASQMKSPARFELAIEAADKELEGVHYNEKNFNRVVNTLKEAIGPENAVQTRFGQDESAITFSNGRMITLRRTENRTFKAASEFTFQMQAASKEAVEQVYNAISKTEIMAQDLIGLVGLIPDTYSALKNILEFAVRHGLVFEDGLIYELQNDEQLKELLNDKIDGVETAILARFPGFAQKAIAERQRRLFRLNSIKLPGALLAVDLIRDFILAASLTAAAGNDLGIMFLGIGSTSETILGNARTLYAHSSEAKRLYDEASESIADKRKYSVENNFYFGNTDDPESVSIEKVLGTFLYELALYKTLESKTGRNIEPRVLGGNSAGAFAGIVISGAVSMEEMISYLEKITVAVETIGAPTRSFGRIAINGATFEQVRDLLPQNSYCTGDSGPQRLSVLVDIPKNVHARGGAEKYMSEIADKIREEVKNRTEFNDAVKISEFLDDRRGVVHHPFYGKNFNDAMKDIVDHMHVSAPVIPILNPSNPAELVTTPEGVRKILMENLVTTVRDAQNISAMSSQGVDAVIAISPGAGIEERAGLLAPGMTAMTVNDSVSATHTGQWIYTRSVQPVQQDDPVAIPADTRLYRTVDAWLTEDEAEKVQVSKLARDDMVAAADRAQSDLLTLDSTYQLGRKILVPLYRLLRRAEPGTAALARIDWVTELAIAPLWVPDIIAHTYGLLRGNAGTNQLWGAAVIWGTSISGAILAPAISFNPIWCGYFANVVAHFIYNLFWGKRDGVPEDLIRQMIFALVRAIGNEYEKSVVRREAFRTVTGMIQEARIPATVIPDMVQLLMPELRNEEFEISWAASTLLKEISTKEGTSEDVIELLALELTPLLKDADVGVRKEAGQIVKKIVEREDVDAEIIRFIALESIEILENTDPEVQREAIAVLGEILERKKVSEDIFQRVIRAIEPFLGDPAPAMRQDAAIVLGRARVKTADQGEYLSTLVKLLARYRISLVSIINFVGDNWVEDQPSPYREYYEKVAQNDGPVAIRDINSIVKGQIEWLEPQGRTLRFRVKGDDGVYHFKCEKAGDREELMREAALLKAIEKGIVRISDKTGIPRIVTKGKDDRCLIHVNSMDKTGILYYAPGEYFSYITHDLNIHNRSKRKKTIETGLSNALLVIEELASQGIFRQEDMFHRNADMYSWVEYYPDARSSGKISDCSYDTEGPGSMQLTHIREWVKYPNISTQGLRDYGHYRMWEDITYYDELFDNMGMQLVYYTIAAAAAFHNNQLKKSEFRQFILKEYDRLGVVPYGGFVDEFWQLIQNEPSMPTPPEQGERELGTRGISLKAESWDAICHAAVNIIMKERWDVPQPEESVHNVALTHGSTYGLGRKILAPLYRFFFRKPVNKAALEKIDRMTELVIAPLWIPDIAAHTIDLLTGKEEFSWHRFVGSGTILAVTAIVISGKLGQHPGSILSAVFAGYVANAFIHFAYNALYGSGTDENAPLTRGSSSAPARQLPEELQELKSEYPELWKCFTPEVIEALSDDSALRPVFLLRLPEEYRGPFLPIDPETAAKRINGVTIADIVESHSAFSVGSAAAAEKWLDQGYTILVGVNDRKSYDVFDSKWFVANGRQAYFPLGDGTWLGVKGSGQYIRDQADTFWKKEYSVVPAYIGLVSETQALCARTGFTALRDKGGSFIQWLGYRPLYQMPDANMHFSAVSNVQGEEFQPVLTFNRVSTPHRLQKWPQLLKSDPGLIKTSKRISKALASMKKLPEGTVLPPVELVNHIIEAAVRTEAVKQNHGWYQLATHSQDINLGGEECDIEDILRTDDYQKIIQSGRFKDDLDLLQAYGLSVKGMRQKLSILTLMLEHSEANKQGSINTLFPNPSAALELFFRGYFRNLDDAHLKLFIHNSILRKMLSNNSIRLDWFHPQCSDIGQRHIQNNKLADEVRDMISNWEYEELSARGRARSSRIEEPGMRNLPVEVPQSSQKKTQFDLTQAERLADSGRLLEQVQYYHDSTQKSSKDIYLQNNRFRGRSQICSGACPYCYISKAMKKIVGAEKEGRAFMSSDRLSSYVNTLVHMGYSAYLAGEDTLDDLESFFAVARARREATVLNPGNRIWGFSTNGFYLIENFEQNQYFFKELKQALGDGLTLEVSFSWDIGKICQYASRLQVSREEIYRRMAGIIIAARRYFPVSEGHKISLFEHDIEGVGYEVDNKDFDGVLQKEMLRQATIYGYRESETAFTTSKDQLIGLHTKESVKWALLNGLLGKQDFVTIGELYRTGMQYGTVKSREIQVIRDGEATKVSFPSVEELDLWETLGENTAVLDCATEYFAANSVFQELTRLPVDPLTLWQIATHDIFNTVMTRNMNYKQIGFALALMPELAGEKVPFADQKGTIATTKNARAVLSYIYSDPVLKRKIELLLLLDNIITQRQGFKLIGFGYIPERLLAYLLAPDLIEAYIDFYAEYANGHSKEDLVSSCSDVFAVGNKGEIEIKRANDISFNIAENKALARYVFSHYLRTVLLPQRVRAGMFGRKDIDTARIEPFSLGGCQKPGFPDPAKITPRSGRDNPGRALTVQSTYELGRKFFRYLHQKLQHGGKILGIEIGRFDEERADRLTELIIAPLWLPDIANHSIVLLSGKEEFSWHRFIGVGVILAGTAVAIAGKLDNHAGIINAVFAGYSVNVFLHFIHNIFFGSNTGWNEPLTYGDHAPVEEYSSEFIDIVQLEYAILDLYDSGRIRYLVIIPENVRLSSELGAQYRYNTGQTIEPGTAVSIDQWGSDIVCDMLYLHPEINGRRHKMQLYIDTDQRGRGIAKVVYSESGAAEDILEKKSAPAVRKKTEKQSVEAVSREADKKGIEKKTGDALLPDAILYSLAAVRSRSPIARLIKRGYLSFASRPDSLIEGIEIYLTAGPQLLRKRDLAKGSSAQPVKINIEGVRYSLKFDASQLQWVELNGRRDKAMDFCSIIRREAMDKVATTNKKIPPLILPRNLPLVYLWKAQGRSAVAIAFRIAVKERFASFAAPFDFFNEHRFVMNTKGYLALAGLVCANYLPVLLAPAYAWSPYNVLTMITGMATGIVSGGIFHFIWDLFNLHNIKPRQTVAHVAGAEEFEANLAKYPNAAELTHLWFTELPAQAEGELVPLGFKALMPGVDIWAGTKEGGLVFYMDLKKAGIPESEYPEALRIGASEILKQLGGTDNIKGDGRAAKRIDKFFKINKKAGDWQVTFKPVMAIDHMGDADALKKNLSAQGINTAVVVEPQTLEPENGLNINAVIEKTLIKHNAVSLALRSNKIVKLDAEAIDEFVKGLNVFNAIGNGQMLVDWELFEQALAKWHCEKKGNFCETTLRALLTQARENGVTVYCGYKAKQGDTSVQLQRILSHGFEGLALDVTGLDEASGTQLINSLNRIPLLSVTTNFEVPEGVKQTRAFTLGEMNPGFDMNTVIDMRIPAGLTRERIQEAMKELPLSNTMILHTEDAGRLINAARDITDKKLFASLLDTLMNFGTKEITTPEIARKTAYHWQISDLPGKLSGQAGKDQIEALLAGDLAGSGIAEGSAIYEQAEALGTQELKVAFLAAIAEKMLVKEQLKEYRKELGMAYEQGRLAFGRHDEEMLGYALVKQARMSHDTIVHDKEDVENIIRGADRQNLNGFLEQLFSEIQGGQARSGSVSAVIDIILMDLFLDQTMKSPVNRKNGTFEIRPVRQILGAA